MLRAVSIPAAYSSSTASCAASSGWAWGICALPLLAHRSELGLQLLAHGRFDLLISRVCALRRVAQRVELADLMGHVRPELLHCQQLALLRIGDRAQHLDLPFHLQSYHWRKPRFHHGRL